MSNQPEHNGGELRDADLIDGEPQEPVTDAEPIKPGPNPYDGVTDPERDE